MIDINWIDPLKYIVGFIVSLFAMFSIAYAFAYGFAGAWYHGKENAIRDVQKRDLIEQIKARMEED